MIDFIISKFTEKINAYYPISKESLQTLLDISKVFQLKKQETLIQQRFVARYFSFLYSGYMVAYITDDKGKTYNKNIFVEGDWVGSMVSAITRKPSEFTLKCITDCVLLSLPYNKFRELVFEKDDLKRFYIHYLEKNWVIDKEKREVSIVMEDAATRYKRLLSAHPQIEQYVPLQDIASHLGITPTQLSRIRSAKR